jgi:hypothetical protein
MRKALPSLAFALLAATSVYAAPAEQASCALDALTEQQQLTVGDYSIVALSRGGEHSQTPPVRQALVALEAANKSCGVKHGWSADEASSALAFATMQLVAKSSRLAIVEMGGDANAADLFYAQNKYLILEENAAGRSSEEWATTRLVEMGFAKKDSPAFDAVWIYLQALFESESQLGTFEAGKMPEWAK